jgi:Na+-translocating ferredoxin:NAD+ oxidoreductase RnfE subunit
MKTLELRKRLRCSVALLLTTVVVGICPMLVVTQDAPNNMGLFSSFRLVEA